MQIQGNWFAAGSAALKFSVLHVRNEQYTLSIEGLELLSGPLESLVVSDRLGNVERKISFEDGSVFATQDNDAVDRAFKGHMGSAGIMHGMESKWRWVVIAVVATVIASVSFFKWGVPAISEGIARALPQKTNELIAGSTLEFLDKYVFEETTLESERMEQIRDHFTANLVPLDSKNANIKYQLHFRDWPEVPNALALPSGDIILTDAFVALTENQAQMDSVLLHEMGHVVHRHSLERVIGATIVSSIVMLVTGDSNGIADMGIGLGSWLVSSHYSRGHETEADQYAFEKMLVAGIDPVAFAQIMGRIESSMDSSDTPFESGKQEEGGVPSEDDNTLLSDYLSSHPNTSERIMQAKQFSECFRLGETVCIFKGKRKADK